MNKEQAGCCYHEGCPTCASVEHDASAAPTTQIIDLMVALKASLNPRVCKECPKCMHKAAAAKGFSIGA